MDALIDTNILYRLSGVMPEGDYSRHKLSQQLKRYNRVIVSEISMYELFTRFRPKIGLIRKKCRYPHYYCTKERNCSDCYD